MTTQTTHSPSSIAFACPCGARGKAPVEAAGRKIRCRRCGETLRVPSGRHDRAARPARPAPRRRSSAEQRILAGGKRPSGKSPSHAAAAPRDRDMEGHLRAIGLWNRGLGLLTTVLALLALPALGLLGVLQLALCGATMVCGHGLQRFDDWARKGLGVLAALGLLAAGFSLTRGTNPLALLLGTAWYSATLWALFSARTDSVFTAQAAAERERDERPVGYLASPFFWAPVVVILGTLMVLGAR